MFGGLISILIAIWIYRTAIEGKTGNLVYWVIGSVVVFLSLQLVMTFFSVMVVESFVVPFFVIAVIRQVLMLKQSFSFMGLFGGIKEMFSGIINSFKTT